MPLFLKHTFLYLIEWFKLGSQRVTYQPRTIASNKRPTRRLIVRERMLAVLADISDWNVYMRESEKVAYAHYTLMWQVVEKIAHCIICLVTIFGLSERASGWVEWYVYLLCVSQKVDICIEEPSEVAMGESNQSCLRPVPIVIINGCRSRLREVKCLNPWYEAICVAISWVVWTGISKVANVFDYQRI